MNGWMLTLSEVHGIAASLNAIYWPIPPSVQEFQACIIDRVIVVTGVSVHHCAQFKKVTQNIKKRDQKGT